MNARCRVPAPPAPVDTTTVFEQPMPFSSGPYTLRSSYIFDRNGVQIGHAVGPGNWQANANLMASSWELLTMLHEYLSTDQCTDHPEGETCKFCVSMNVIRRAMGQPDEQVPLLTWFARFKEQQTIAGSYKDLYEKHCAKATQVCHDMQERIFTLESKLGRLRISAPAQATALANAVAEISIIKAALEK